MKNGDFRKKTFLQDLSELRVSFLFHKLFQSCFGILAVSCSTKLSLYALKATLLILLSILIQYAHALDTSFLINDKDTINIRSLNQPTKWSTYSWDVNQHSTPNLISSLETEDFLFEPVADEICNNGLDDDGDGLLDCADPDCNAVEFCNPENSCGSLGDNVVINGDFEQGYFGFSSDLGRGSNNPVLGGCNTQGWYAVGKKFGTQNLPYFNGPTGPGSYTSADPNDISNTGLVPGNNRDHTTGDGNFLVIDPNDRTGVEYWYQDILLCEGQRYVFSAWFKDISRDVNPQPKLSFAIDGQLLFPYTEFPVNDWRQVSAVYVAQVSGISRIALVNGQPGCDGNDVAIDDISLRACDGNFVVIKGDPAICRGEDIVLSVSLQDLSYQDPEYQWQRSIDGGNSWIDIPGANFPDLVYDNPADGMQFRLLTSDLGNINTPSCRVGSNVIQTVILNCVEEICRNGLDDDGDGLIDENDSDCPLDDTPVCAADGGIKYYLPSVWRNNSEGFPHSLFLSTSFPEANINVTNTDGSFNQDFTIAAETPLEVALNTQLIATNQVNTPERNKGLIITSDVPISPLYRITNNNNRVLANLKGASALGRSFRLATPVRTDGNGGNQERHYFSIMATADNTVITIDDSPFPLRGINLPFTFTLNAGETIMMHPDDDDDHLTGTLIVSDKAISVITGTQHTEAQGTNDREASADVVIPFTNIGKDYVCMRGGFPTSLHDYVMVVAVLDGTQVFLDNIPFPQATLAAGEFTLIELNGNRGDPHYIQATKDVYAYHVSGIANTGGEFGMAVLPPVSDISCTGSKYVTVPRFDGGGLENDLYIISPNNGLVSLTIDGQPYTNYGTAVPIPGYNGFSAVYLNQDALPENVNEIQSNKYVYVGQFVGNDDTGAYGFYSEYDSRVDILDPVQALPTTYYIADTVCIGRTINHTLLAESCGLSHKIVAGVQGNGSISFSDNSLTLSYTAEVGGLDIIQLTVENENGVQGTVCIGFFVPEPEADAGPDQTVCLGETIEFQGSGGGSYSWTPPNGLSAAGIATPTLRPQNTRDYQLTVTDEFGCKDIDSVKVSVNPTPELSPQRPGLCEDDSRNVNLSVYEGLLNPSTSTGTFTYADVNWTPIQTPNDFDATDGEFIRVIFVDDNTGCTDTTNISFSVQPSIVVPPQTIEICREDAGSVDLTVYEATISPKEGIFTYTNGAGNVINNPSNVRVANGENIFVNFSSALCDATATYTFQFRDPPTAFAGEDTTICPDTELALNGEGGVSLSWLPHPTLSDTSVANPIVIPLNLTAYYLRVVDQFGCVGFDTVVVDLNPPTPANAGVDASICQGETTQLRASGGVTYQWDNELSLSDPTIANPIASPGITTSYAVEVTDVRGCSRIDTVEVEVRPVPRADAGEDLAICAGETIDIIGGGGLIYEWMPARGLSSTTISNPIFQGNATTTYVLTVTNDVGCSSKDTMTVSVNPLPAALINVSRTEICRDDPVLFEANGADTYRWIPEFEFPDPNAQRTTINPLASSLYVLEGLTTEGCASRDSVFVIIQNGPNVIITPDSSICEGDTVWLGVSGAVSYTWSTDQEVDTIRVIPSETTDYWVIPFSNLGCPGDTAFSSVRVVPYPLAMFSPDADSGFTPKAIEFQNQSELATNYMWDFGDGSTSELENPTHVYNEEGQYTVKLTAFNELGCLDTVSFSFLDILMSRLYVPNAFTPNDDGFNEVFRFPHIGIEVMTMKIFTRWGDLIYEETSEDPSWDGVYKGVTVPEGVYVYKLDVLEIGGFSYTRAGTVTLIR